MIDDDQRAVCEQLAVCVEWALDPPDAGTLATDLHLAPEAARTVLAEMVERYEGLAEWAEVAKSASFAQAAVEVANEAGAPLAITNALQQKADLARAALGKQARPNADNHVKVLSAFAALQRISAQRPDLD